MKSGGGGPSVEELLKRLERVSKARAEAESIAEGATADLYSAMQELKMLNQSLRDFIAMASHDIRSPLATVLGFASTLTGRWDAISEDRRREFVGMIERSARQVSRLVETMLTLSQIEAGALKTHAEVVDFSRVMLEVMDQFEERMNEIHLQVEGQARILADPDHIQRILTNYLTNAFKYGEPPLEVTLQDDGDFVVLCVSDRGPGVPEDFVPFLFGKFTRADEAKRISGSGLGLSIVKGLAQANGGDAWYEPNQPRGSCFKVKLPKVA